MAATHRGIADMLLNSELASTLDGLVQIEGLDPAEAHRYLSQYAQRLVSQAVSALPGDQRASMGVALINALLDELVQRAPRASFGMDDRLVDPAQLVLAIGEDPKTLVRPLTPLSDTALFTNAPDEPQAGAEIARELISSDRVDALVAFVKWSGLRLIEEQLREFLDSGRQLRLITTTYTGATERKALDRLARMGVEVKVAYDNRTTRLHAKAWVFHRNTGFDTAWIGSSNLSKSALVDGLEWNIRASRVTAPEVIDKCVATFDSYWSDPHFESYDPDQDAERFDEAIGSARNDRPIDISFLDVRPWPYQQDMLDRLQVERERHDRWRNLVVAATGTGKTVVAALDFRRLREQLGELKLLFVAHRKEILQQSLSTFRAALRDGSFGEIYVDGQRPEKWQHVFASIQSLTAIGADTIDASHFDVVIVDEFHHAGASTYRALLEHVTPHVLVGLTATPERADGQSVLEWFDNRIAVELRLWDALDRNLLIPFHYFGLHDDVDLSHLTWSRGGYQLSDLDKLYTGNDVRVAKVLEAVNDKVTDPHAMKALGFCVSIAHAEYMASKFTQAGIPSVAVSANTSSQSRADALRTLRNGGVNAVFAVDLFNEGVDVPEIDTVLFLRPTESVTVFLQQLGRGLRHATGKSVLTVLDFVGHQHKSFRFDLRYRALTGDSRKKLIDQVEEGFPFLPSGCHIELDRVARKLVIDNIKQSLPNRWPQRVTELRTLGDVGLAQYLSGTGLEVSDVYQAGRSWTDHRRAAGLDKTPTREWDKKLSRALGRMLHIEDKTRIDSYRKFLGRDEPPADAPLTEYQRRLAFMLHLSLWGVQDKMNSMREGFERLWASPLRGELAELIEILDNQATHLHQPLGVDLPSPLVVHARYSRDEALAAMGLGSPQKPPSVREGVKWDKDSQADLFFVTLDKSDRDFSPSTRYNDYAISPELFHWESQSFTTTDSKTGQRYLNHRTRNTHVLLFVRETKKAANGAARPYLFLGPVDYVSHRGERPIAITWRLRRPMPGDFYQRAKAVAG